MRDSLKIFFLRKGILKQAARIFMAGRVNIGFLRRPPNLPLGVRKPFSETVVVGVVVSVVFEAFRRLEVRPIQQAALALAQREGVVVVRNWTPERLVVGQSCIHVDFVLRRRVVPLVHRYRTVVEFLCFESVVSCPSVQ